MPNEPQTEYRWRIIKQTKDNDHKRPREDQSDNRHKQQNGIIRIISEICGQAKAGEKEEDRRWRCERNLHIGEIFALLAAAIVGIGAILVGSSDTNESIFQANRAWIAPVGVLMSVPKVGDTIGYRITYQNVGRSPALEINRAMDGAYKFIHTDEVSDWENMPENTTCKGLAPLSGGPVEFPVNIVPNSRQILHEFWNDTRFQPDHLVADRDMYDDKVHRFYIQGCIIYKTMRRIVGTKFCFGIQWIHDGIGNPILKNGNPSYNYYACSSGRYAE